MSRDKPQVGDYLQNIKYKYPVSFYTKGFKQENQDPVSGSWCRRALSQEEATHAGGKTCWSLLDPAQSTKPWGQLVAKPLNESQTEDSILSQKGPIDNFLPVKDLRFVELHKPRYIHQKRYTSLTIFQANTAP